MRSGGEAGINGRDERAGARDRGEGQDADYKCQGGLEQRAQDWELEQRAQDDKSAARRGRRRTRR